MLRPANSAITWSTSAILPGSSASKYRRCLASATRLHSSQFAFPDVKSISPASTPSSNNIARSRLLCSTNSAEIGCIPEAELFLLFRYATTPVVNRGNTASNKPGTSRATVRGSCSSLGIGAPSFINRRKRRLVLPFNSQFEGVFKIELNLAPESIALIAKRIRCTNLGIPALTPSRRNSYRSIFYYFSCEFTGVDLRRRPHKLRAVLIRQILLGHMYMAFEHVSRADAAVVDLFEPRPFPRSNAGIVKCFERSGRL